ncbi:MAG: trigger factor [Candidatus Omnitrophica bacterium]|nr:trigger factor [Candidatus Omnitrophota bacterium]
MEYTVKKTHPCEREIAILIGEEFICSAKNEYYDEIAKEVVVPGYRKGKAPREVLETQFADKAKEAVIRQLISVALKKISEAENFKIIAYPKVNDMQYSDTELKLKIEVELDPEFILGNYKGIKAKRPAFEIKDEEVSETIEKIRETFASFIPVSREARMNDYLIADYQVEIEGKPNEEHKDEWIFLHEHHILGDFSQKLIGIKADEDRKFSVTLGIDHPNQELRGKQAQFSIKVKEVKEKSMPEVNDEFAKLAGEYKDLEVLKQAVREDIKRKKEQEQEGAVEHEILNYLIQNNVFDVSRGVVERHLDKLVHDAINRMVQRGFTKEQAEKEHANLVKEFHDEAEKQVRLSFILDKIAQKENVQINQQDLNERFDRMARQYHAPIDKIKEHFQKEENFESLIEQIINEKVFKLIKDNAEITNA